jgi:hypothetical protein
MTDLEAAAVVPDALTPTDAGAADAAMLKPNGTPCSQQRGEQIEAIARRKLDLGRSIAAAVHGAERAGRALILTAGGRSVSPDELQGSVRTRRRKARWQIEHEAVVRAFLRSRV